MTAKFKSTSSKKERTNAESPPQNAGRWLMYNLKRIVMEHQIPPAKTNVDIQMNLRAICPLLGQPWFATWIQKPDFKKTQLWHRIARVVIGGYKNLDDGDPDFVKPKRLFYNEELGENSPLINSKDDHVDSSINHYTNKN